MPGNSEERLAAHNLAVHLSGKFEERGRFETGFLSYAQTTTSITRYRQLFSSETCTLFVNEMDMDEGETSNSRAIESGSRWNFGVTNVLVVIFQAESTNTLLGRTAQQYAEQARDMGTTVLAVRGARAGEGKIPRRVGSCVRCTGPEDPAQNLRG